MYENALGYLVFSRSFLSLFEGFLRSVKALVYRALFSRKKFTNQAWFALLFSCSFNDLGH
jgi:hypothetical protein